MGLEINKSFFYSLYRIAAKLHEDAIADRDET